MNDIELKKIIDFNLRVIIYNIKKYKYHYLAILNNDFRD